MKAAMLGCAILLSACGGGSGGGGGVAVPPAASNGANDNPPPPPATNQNETLIEAIRRNEAAGRIPKLDRSPTLAGTDNDGNGVRDDIDAYIAGLPDNADQKAALRQTAAALGKALVTDTSDQNALREAFNKLAAASACLQARYGSPDASRKNARIEMYTMNTKQRVLAYLDFGKALSGVTVPLPRGDGCVVA